jgi:hypothetical protein
VKADEEDVRAERDLCERRIHMMVNAMRIANVPVPDEVFRNE